MNKNLDEKKSEYLLEMALEEQLENDEDMRHWAQVEEENPPHVFSKRHNKRMRKIFRKAKRVEYYELYRKRALRMVAGFLVIFCASVITVTQVEAFRTPLMRFFTDVKAKSTLFGVEKESKFNLTKNFQKYEPTYIPDGFVVVKVDEHSTWFSIKCENDNGQFYRYYFCNDVKNFALDTEESAMISTEINGNRASIIQKENEIKIIIYKNDTIFYLEAKLPIEEAYKIMESIL